LHLRGVVVLYNANGVFSPKFSVGLLSRASNDNTVISNMSEIVKNSMKNHSGTCGKIRKTLPLVDKTRPREGGGRRVGVKE